MPFSALCVGHSECQRLFDLYHTAEVVLLRFEGITYGGRVYLNGVFVSELLPYCEYTLDVTDVVKEKNNNLLVEIEDVSVPFGPSEVAAKIIIHYGDGETQCHEIKNGVDLTLAYSSVGSSRINPVAENARRFLSFSYDKNFESYVINYLKLPTTKKMISKVEIQSTSPNYNTLIYGVFFQG